MTMKTSKTMPGLGQRKTNMPGAEIFRVSGVSGWLVGNRAGGRRKKAAVGPEPQLRALLLKRRIDWKLL